MTQNVNKAGPRMYSRELVNPSFGWDEVSVQAELEEVMDVRWFDYTGELIAAAAKVGLTVFQAAMTFGLLYGLRNRFLAVPCGVFTDDNEEIPVLDILALRARLGSLDAFGALVERELMADAENVAAFSDENTRFEGINLVRLSLWDLGGVQISFLLERPDCSPKFPFWRIKGEEAAACEWLRGLTPQDLCVVHGLLRDKATGTVFTIWEEALASVAELQEGMDAVRSGAPAPKGTPAAYHWLALGMKVPGNLAVRTVHPAVISALRGRERVWGQALNLARRQVRTSGEESHVLLAATKLVAWFGEQAPAVVCRLGGDWHRAGIDLPDRVVDASVARLAVRAGSRARMLSITKLALHKVAIEGAGIELFSSGGVQRALEFAAALKYEGQTHDAFALIASAAELDPEMYMETETRWLRGLKGFQSQSVFAPVVAPVEGLTFLQLDKTDPRALFAGAFTECCQHPGGVGATSAWEAHQSPDSAVWAVFSTSGRMVAQAWVWRSGSTLVLDSIEVTLSVSYHARLGSAVMRLFRHAARFSVGRFGIERVLLGLGSATDLIFDEVNGEPQFVLDVPAPKGVYTDASCVCRFA